MQQRLNLKYGVDIDIGAQIAPGLRIAHLPGVVITRYVSIGRNFFIRQNCSIGIKTLGLQEYALRIGDNVKVDTFEGRILDINTRYSVIRSPAGRESIVPNELMVINRVENLSSAITRVWQTSVVTVGYDSDVELVGRLLLQAVDEQEAALKEPAPQASLSAFGASGLEFTVGYWINSGDGAEQLKLLSLINLGILRLLREHGIEMPYPQSVVHVQPLPAPAAPGGASSGHQAG